MTDEEWTARFALYTRLLHLMRVLGEVGTPWPVVRRQVAATARDLLRLCEEHDA